MMTKTIRSPFNHEVGQKVEGCTILEKRVVIPPDPVERRRGIYDYLVEVAPTAVKPRSGRDAAHTRRVDSGHRPDTRATPDSVTRATPEEMLGTVIRRFTPR
jgi:hypothetical protein